MTGTNPAPVGTILPTELMPSSTPTRTNTLPPSATSTSIEPLIPITGENVVSLQCQFCVDSTTYAVLVFPDFAYFDVISSSPVSCFTANVVNGQRILLCRGTQQTSFNLNICSDSTNCLQFPVELQACPLLQADSGLGTSTPATPIFLTAINTLQSRDDNDDTPAQPSNTARPPLTAQPNLPTASPPPAVTTAAPLSTSTSIPVPTDEPAPTSAPEPTDDPDPTDPPPAEPTDEPTDEPGNGGGPGRPTRRPSITPRP